MKLLFTNKINIIKNLVAKKVIKHPQIFLTLQAFYHRTSIVERIVLNCFRPSKSILQNERLIGPNKNQVLIETIFSSINTGTELAVFNRKDKTKVDFPYTPSGSGVGRILKSGNNVKNLKKGDLVVGSFKHSSKQVLNINSIARINKNIGLKNASLFHLAIIAMQGIRMSDINESKIKIAIIGQGIIGRLATLILRAMGHKVICITLSRKKLDFFNEAYGLALSSNTDNEKVKTLNAKVVIDASGDPESIHTAMSAACYSGRIVLLGSSRGNTSRFSLDGQAKKKKLTICGAHINNINNSMNSYGVSYLEEVNFLEKLMIENNLSFETLITHEISDNDIEKFYTHKLAKLKSSCGIIINWTSKKINIRPFTLKKNKPSQNKSQKLKIALIGTGNIGKTNIEAILKCKSFDLKIIVDKNIETAKNLGIAYNIKYTDDIKKVLESTSIDAAFLAVPHNLHYELSMQLIESKKHVLIEKPITISIQESKKIIEKAKKNQIVALTNLSFPFQEHIQYANQLINEDIIGKIFGAFLEINIYRKNNYWYDEGISRFQKSWRAKKNNSGGGVLIMNAIHEIDLLLSLTGIEVKEVFSKCTTNWHPVDFEDNVSVILYGSKGEIITIIASNTVRGSKGDLRPSNNDKLKIWGECGQLIVTNEKIDFYSLKQLGQFLPQTWHTLVFKEDLSHRSKFLDYFGDKIKSDFISGFDERGLVSLTIVKAAYKSSELNRPVSLNELLGD